MRKICFICLWAVLLSACRGQNGQEFMAPEIFSLEAEVSGATAVLRATLSDSRVDRCGFSLSDGETTLLLDATLEDMVFSATAKGLVFNKTYRWEAFAIAGNATIRSQEQDFTVPEGGIPIPDLAFREYLIQQFDQDKDGNLSVSEANRIEKIDVNTDQISSLQGIEYMPNLHTLYVNGTSPGRGGLTELDLSSNPKIGDIQCFNNQIRSLNVSHNLVLEKLLCWENLLTELDVSHNTCLQELSCAQNLFSSLDISNNPVLREFHFNDTFISDIDLSANPKLENLSCWGTFLTQLDVSKNLQLSHLDCAPSLGNLLEVIYVASGQVIPGITENRDSELIPENTRVEVKSVE